jgi:ATP-binding cassette subfamily B protein
MDCGPTCIKMIALHYGRFVSLEKLKNLAGISKSGVSLFGISEACEGIGLRTVGAKLSFTQLREDAKLPCIAHWNQNHYIVIVEVSKSLFSHTCHLKVADPAKGIINYTEAEFKRNWESTFDSENDPMGTVLLVEPGPRFFEEEDQEESGVNVKGILNYLKSTKWQLFQIFLALLITSGLQLIFPFLTQNIVDSGINTKNLSFITIILIAQLVLVFSRVFVDFIRARLLLVVSSILNMSILSDFWLKLTKLPLSFFDAHHTGDILQRLSDNKQIQNFLTGSALNTIFSFVNFIIYSLILLQYKAVLFFIFIGGAFLYFFWVRIFLSFRRKLNYKNFDLASKENSCTLQLVQGMQEIRLNNAEKTKRWEWESIQASIYKLGFKNLSYAQLQQSGAILINQGKDVILTFIVANLVIEGQLSLGAMVAIQYILGQLNSPIEQWVSFVQSAQDAKISLERINEIHKIPEEDHATNASIMNLPTSKWISIERLSFSYPGAKNKSVLRDISLQIPQAKTTAIVGMSGSGKTTLLKLLLRFYEDYHGEIKVGELNLKALKHYYWRSECGAVLQEGFIFNDTVAKNISISDEYLDYDRLINACKLSNILDFVEGLPNGFNTKLGANGMGISQGQKQRILIARAIYKNPEYIFLDEATNSLDANNEKEIVEQLAGFLRGKTVVIVAHRLSTVKNADKIVVLDKGRIIEEGNHQSLSAKRGKYYDLVKNQLELDS